MRGAQNDSVPTINKLNCLFSLLEWPAYRAVEGLELQESNYETVIDILKLRFGKNSISLMHICKHCLNFKFTRMQT